MIKVQEIIKENNKYRLVFETNEITGVHGVFVIETLSGNMLCNFSDELKAIKQWEEHYTEDKKQALQEYNRIVEEYLK